MTQEELFKLWSEMRKQRVDNRLLPYEPSPIEFGARVADKAYDRGYNVGYGTGVSDSLGD
jgi:hypothetical protein